MATVTKKFRVTIYRSWLAWFVAWLYWLLKG
jgi:hypothetical protein